MIERRLEMGAGGIKYYYYYYYYLEEMLLRKQKGQELLELYRSEFGDSQDEFTNEVKEQFAT